VPYVALSLHIDLRGLITNSRSQGRSGNDATLFEAVGLRWDDAELEHGTLRVGRSLVRDGGRYTLGETKRGRRLVNLTARTVKALKAHRKGQLEERVRLSGSYDDQGLIFSTRVGTPVNPENLVKWSFKPLLEKAALPKICFHDLRHTCATLLLGRDVHPKLVQELLGHATVAITLDTYTHYLPSMGDQAAWTMGDALG
jgi:integrase